MENLNKQKILSLYKGKTIIEVFDEVTSTNALIHEKRSRLLTDTVFIAKKQTDGKGRFDRNFSSEEGGIYLSYLFKSNLSLSDVKFVTPCVAVATASAIEKTTGERIEIKWVNDLYLNDKKICGILSECKTSSQGASGVIVGIGINVNTESFPAELNNATSLFLETGKRFNLNEIIACLIYKLDALYDEIRRKIFIEEYRSRLLLTGKTLLFKNKEYVCQGIDDDCRLLLKNATENLAFSVGEVTVRNNRFVYEIN